MPCDRASQPRDAALAQRELLSLPDNADGDQEFRDRSTGLPLNPEMVKKARELDMQYMEELKFLEDSHRDACMAETGLPPIPLPGSTSTRALHSDPTTEAVCQETRGRSTIDVETGQRRSLRPPPCEAFNLQLSLMMAGARSQVEGDDDVLMLLDISGAHLHSPLARAVFVTIDGKVLQVVESNVRSERDAGAALDRKVLDVMNWMGVSLGRFSICVGYRKVMDTTVRLVRWCDDFSLSGRRSLCDAVRDELGKHLLVKTTVGDGTQC